MILKVHPSNFRIVGFTEEPRIEELAELARAAGVPLVEDQGSGLLEPLPGALAPEATAAQALRGGADAVTFSGDKLLGGPQAGLVAGRRACVEPIARTRLSRPARGQDGARRPRCDARRARERPRARARARPAHAARPARRGAGPGRGVRRGGRRGLPRPSPALVPGESAVGGGASPTVGVPTVVVALDPGAAGPDRLAAALRRGEPPVVVRVAGDRVLVDLRTVLPDEEEPLLAALLGAARG